MNPITSINSANGIRQCVYNFKMKSLLQPSPLPPPLLPHPRHAPVNTNFSQLNTVYYSCVFISANCNKDERICHTYAHHRNSGSQSHRSRKLVIVFPPFSLFKRGDVTISARYREIRIIKVIIGEKNGRQRLGGGV